MSDQSNLTHSIKMPKVALWWYKVESEDKKISGKIAFIKVDDKLLGFDEASIEVPAVSFDKKILSST